MKLIKPSLFKSQDTITFLPMDETVPIRKAESVLDVALSNKIPLNHSCGGMGSCTTCRVIVESELSQLNERNEVEQEMAEMRQFSANERLACQLRPEHGMVLRIPVIKDEPGT